MTNIRKFKNKWSGQKKQIDTVGKSTWKVTGKQIARNKKIMTNKTKGSALVIKKSHHLINKLKRIPMKGLMQI